MHLKTKIERQKNKPLIINIIKIFEQFTFYHFLPHLYGSFIVKILSTNQPVPFAVGAVYEQSNED